MGPRPGVPGFGICPSEGGSAVVKEKLIESAAAPHPASTRCQSSRVVTQEAPLPSADIGAVMPLPSRLVVWHNAGDRRFGAGAMLKKPSLACRIGAVAMLLLACAWPSAGRCEATRVEVRGDDRLTVRVEHLEALPSLVYHLFPRQGLPLVQVTLTNTSDKAQVLGLACSVKNYTDEYSEYPILLAPGEEEVRSLAPPLARGVYKGLREQRPDAGLSLTVSRKEEDRMVRAVEFSSTLTILRYDTFVFDIYDIATHTRRDLLEFLTVLVTPNDGTLESVLEKAAARTSTGSLISYQSRKAFERKPYRTGLVGGSGEGVREQVKAIYDALQMDFGFRYIDVADASMGYPESGLQQVRLPADSLRNNAANCIDGSVLFASLLERIGIEPYILVRPGHALLGWKVMDPGSGRTLGYDVLETTRIGLNYTFEEAREHALQHEDLEAFTKGDFARSPFVILSVEEARSKGITPIYEYTDFCGKVQMMVLNFRNLSLIEPEKYGNYGPAITESMITAMKAAHDKIEVMDFATTIAALRDASMTTDSDITPVAAARVGKKAGVQYMVLGSYEAGPDFILMRGKVVGLESGKVLASAEVSGKIADFHKGRQELIEKIAQALDMELSPSEQLAMSRNQTVDAGTYLETFATGLKHYELRRYDEAVTAFGKVLASEPRFARAKYYLGLCYQEQGKFDKSEAELKAALKGTGQVAPVKVWSTSLMGRVKAPPALTAETVFVGTQDWYLHALDRRSGKERWRFLARGPLSAAPAVRHGIVYFGSDDGHIYALDAVDGRLKWKFRTGWRVASTPLVVDEVVYIGSLDTRMYALEAGSGKVKWNLRTGGAIVSSPVLDRGLLHFGSEDGNLYAVDARDGRVAWVCQVGRKIYSSPELSAEMVFVGTAGGGLSAVDRLTGQLTWTFDTGGDVRDKPILWKGLVIFGSWDRSIRAVNASDGSLAWEYYVGYVDGEATLFENRLFVVSGAGSTLDALDPLSGRLSGRMEVGLTIEAPVVIEGNTAYTGSWEMKAVALNLAAAFEERDMLSREDIAFALASVLEAAGDTAKARDAYASVLSLRPDHVVAARRMAEIAGTQGDTSGALEKWKAFQGMVQNQPELARVATEHLAMLEKKLGLVWAAEVEAQTVFSATAAGNLVFAGDALGNVHAFRSDNGKRIWQTKTSGAVKAQPVVVGKQVFVVNWEGEVSALDVRNGKRLWTVQTGHLLNRAPAPLKEGLLLGVGGHLDLLSFRTGETIASHAIAPGAARIITTPTVSGDIVYVATSDNYVRAWSLSQKKENFSFAAGGPISGTILAGGGLIYFGADDGLLHALDSRSGKIAWQRRVGTVRFAAELAGRTLVVGSGNELLFALDSVEGTLKWKARISFPRSQPFASGGLVYVQGSDGFLRGFDLRNGEQVWAFHVGSYFNSTSPASNGKRLYWGSGEHRLLALEPPATPDDIEAKWYQDGFRFQHERDTTRALEAYRNVLSLNPDHPFTLLNIALLLDQAKRSREGAEYLRKAIAADRELKDYFLLQAEAANSAFDYPRAFALLRIFHEAFPDNADVSASLGDVVFNLDELDKAAEYYRKAEQSDPGLPGPHLGLASIHRVRREFDESLEQTEMAMKRSTTSEMLHWALVQKTWTLRAMHRYDDAIVAVRQALDIFPEDRFARQVLGDLYFNKGQTDRAINELRVLASIYPEEPDVHNSFAYMMAKSGKDLDTALRHVETAIRLNKNPASLPAYISTRGEIRIAMGDFRGARDDIMEALPLATATQTDVLREAHFDLGEINWSQGEFDEAIDEMQKGLAIDPDYPAAKEALEQLLDPALRDAGFAERQKRERRYLALLRPREERPLFHCVVYRLPDGLAVRYVFADGAAAGAGLRTGDLIVALDGAAVVTTDDLSTTQEKSFGETVTVTIVRDGEKRDLEMQLVTLPPGEVAYHEASLLYAAGDYDGAIRAWKKSLESDPDNGMAWHSIGESRVALGQFDQSIEAFEKATLCDPTSPDPYRAIGWVLWQKMNSPEEALPHLQKAVTVYPADSSAYRHIGDIHVQQGRDEPAAKAYKAAIDCCPETAEGAFVGLVRLLMRQGDTVQARTVAERYVEVQPDSQLAHIFLAWVLLADADSFGALSALNRAIALDCTSELGTTARESARKIMER